jgi:hypothetical protein
MAADHIKPVTPGTSPTLLEAAKANEVIGALNRLLRMEVRFVDTGRSELIVSQENAVLVISRADVT